MCSSKFTKVSLRLIRKYCSGHEAQSGFGTCCLVFVNLCNPGRSFSLLYNVWRAAKQILSLEVASLKFFYVMLQANPWIHL